MLSQDKGLKGFHLSVLGTDYLIRCVDATEMPSWFFKSTKGSCDYTTHVITVENLVSRKEDYQDVLGDLETIINQAVRHELIHAFLRESGLGDEGEADEIIVDWFALQAPKIFKAFCQAKALSQQEIRECTEAFSNANIKGGEIDASTRITNGN